MANPWLNQRLENTGNMAQQAEQRALQKRKASFIKRTPRAGGLLNNNATLLDNLFKIGAFGNISYNKAVDGKIGPKTRAAIKKAEEMGYIINERNGSITKENKYIHYKERVPEQTNNNNLGKLIENAFDYATDNMIYRPIRFQMNLAKPILKSIFLNSELQEDKKRKILLERNNYFNTLEYSSKINKVRNSKSDRLENLYLSRLGMLGLVKNKDGTYRCYDDHGKIITNCALTVNLILKSLGNHLNTDGNAWDSKGIYGQENIFNGNILPKVGRYFKPYSDLRNTVAGALGQLNLLTNNIDLKTGDVVGLSSVNSDYNEIAWNNGTDGRSNSHEGIVFLPNDRKDQTYIIHNIHGKVYVDPITKFTGLNPDWGITQVYRPKPKSVNNSNTNNNEKYYYTTFDRNGNKHHYFTVDGMKKFNINIHNNNEIKDVNILKTLGL